MFTNEISKLGLAYGQKNLIITNCTKRKMYKFMNACISTRIATVIQWPNPSNRITLI